MHQQKELRLAAKALFIKYTGQASLYRIVLAEKNIDAKSHEAGLGLDIQINHPLHGLQSPIDVFSEYCGLNTPIMIYRASSKS